MRIQTCSSMVFMLVALSVLGGCSQSKQNNDSMSSQSDGSLPSGAMNSPTTAQVDVNSNGNGSVQVQANGQYPNGQYGNGQYPAGQYPADTTGGYGSPLNSGNGSAGQVNVNAPLTRVNVDRDSGSVHVRVPFVRIDSDGRGQGAHVEIGGHRSEQRDPSSY